MLQTFKSILGLASGTPHAAVVKQVPVAVQVAPDDVKAPTVPVYPPIDGGIPMMSANAVVASQSALVDRLRRHLALPQAEFEANYMQPILRLSELVGLLPATKDKHFTGQGGLFRMCLEIAAFSAQAADGVMFAGHAKIERRRQVEDAWRHAAFFCGMAVELHRPLTEMVIVEATSGATWNPFMGPLTGWAQRSGVQRVHVRWMEPAMQQPGAKSTAVWSLNYLLGADILAALHSVDTAIVQTMAGVVTDAITVVDDHALAKLVRNVRRSAIERDQALRPSLYGALTQGAHLEPYFLDAMRGLVIDGDWKLNVKGARLNYGKEGCFITWPLGAKDVVRRMQEKNVKGIPTQEATLADMLLTAGIITRAPDGGALWSIRTVHDQAKEVLAVRLSNPSSLLGVLEVQPAPAPDALVGPLASPTQAATALQIPPTPPAPAIPKIRMADPETGEILDQQVVAVHAPDPDSKVGPAQGGGVSAAAGANADLRKPGVAKERRTAAGKADAQSPSASAAGTPAAVAPANPRSKAGALPEVEPTVQDQSTLDKQTVAALGPALAAVMATWVDDWNSSRKPRMFAVVTEGLALRLELLTKCGLEMPAIQEPLKSNGFIHLTEVGGRARVMTKVRFGDEEDHAYILKMSFAKRCGFVLA